MFILNCILLEIKHGQIRDFRKTRFLGTPGRGSSSLSFIGWYLAEYSYVSFTFWKKNNEWILRIIAIRRFEDKKKCIFFLLRDPFGQGQTPMGHGSFPINDPIFFFFFLLSSNTFSYIFESIVDVKALLCIFFISCPRNKWFVNGISLSALLSTVFCYQFAWKQSMYAGNAGSRNYRYNSFRQFGQYSLQTYEHAHCYRLLTQSEQKRVVFYVSPSSAQILVNGYLIMTALGKWPKWSFFCHCT